MKPEVILKKEIVVVLLAMLCCLLWGSAFPCIKTGYKLFEIGSDDTFTQILFAGMRFFLAGTFTVLLGSIKKPLIPSRAALPKIAVLSIFQTILQYLFFYMGLARTSGIKGSVLNSSNVFFAILISALIFRHEKLTAKKLCGCALGFAGVIVINLTGAGFDLNFTPFGDGFIILSSVSYAFSAAFTKMFSKTENPVMLSGYQFILGGAVMIVAGLACGGRIHTVNFAGILMLIYLGLLSCIAFSVWGLLLKYNPVSKISIYGFMNPVFGVILSAIFLSESGSFALTRVILSLVLISLGIVVVNRGNK